MSVVAKPALVVGGSRLGRRRALIAAVAAIVSTAALGQNLGLEAAYGTVTLVGGFLPDPATIAVVAGGGIDAAAVAQFGGQCVGFIADAPDVQLTYTPNTAGGQLHIFVTAGVDTTLVISGPNGAWHCNDDTNDLDPLVTFVNPAAGVYDIWVGTIGTPNGDRAVLSISEFATR